MAATKQQLLEDLLKKPDSAYRTELIQKAQANVYGDNEPAQNLLQADLVRAGYGDLVIQYFGAVDPDAAQIRPENVDQFAPDVQAQDNSEPEAQEEEPQA